MFLKPLHEQVVVVVGASSGIGRETALRAAARGARVVAAARGEEGLASLVGEIGAAGGDAIAMTVDVADFHQVEALANRAAAHYGRIDTWVHLAAVGVWGTLEQISPAEFAHVITVNLTGQAYGAMAALPHLRRAGGGALVHVTSGEADLPLPLQSAYAASKSGLVGMLDALRMELARDGAPISVTNVMPSGINTPFSERAATKIGVMPRPLPPLYDPRLVADAILVAAERPMREIVVGGAAKAGIVARRIAPRLVDRVLTLTAFALQRTSHLRAADAPHNLFTPVAGYARVDGPFTGETRSFSVYTWLATHPRAARALGTLVLATTALIVVARRRVTAESEPGLRSRRLSQRLTGEGDAPIPQAHHQRHPGSQPASE